MGNWLEALGESFRGVVSRGDPLPPMALQGALRRTTYDPSEFFVSHGQFTFDVEGIEDPGSRFHSRMAHVPSSFSGITVGRGFDLGTQSPDLIASFLSRAGLDREYVRTAVRAAGLRGAKARQFLNENYLGEITATQQRNLFELIYDYIERDVRRIVAKPDVVAQYGETDWHQLSPVIREMVIDLRYRGDYTPRTREKLQQSVSENNLPDFIMAMSDREFWVAEIGVPQQRYQARLEFVRGRWRE